MRSKKNLPVFLAYAATSLLVLAYLGAQMGGEFFFDRGYHVGAVFATGSQLVTGDDVDINGLRVGKVDSVTPVGGGALVNMVVHSQFAPLFGDAKAVIKSKNLLGETYVELNRGTSAAAPLPDGGRISKDNTLTPVEIDEVLDTLDQGTRDRLVLAINSLGGALNGRGADLNQQGADLKVLAVSLETIGKSLASSQEQLDTLISSFTKVLQTLAAWHTQFRQLVADWDQLMRTLESRESDFQGFFVQQDRVLGIVDQALAGNGATGLHQAISEAPSSLTNLNHYLDQGAVVFPGIAKESPDVASLFFELASVMSGVDPSTGQHMWRVNFVGGCQTLSAPQAALCPQGVTGVVPLPGSSSGGGH